MRSVDALSVEPHKSVSGARNWWEPALIGCRRYVHSSSGQLYGFVLQSFLPCWKKTMDSCCKPSARANPIDTDNLKQIYETKRLTDSTTPRLPNLSHNFLGFLKFLVFRKNTMFLKLDMFLSSGETVGWQLLISVSYQSSWRKLEAKHHDHWGGIVQ